MFPIMSEGNGKSQVRESDPAKLAEQLEIELILKRAAWQQSRARHGNLRAISLAFLFLIVLGALGGVYFLLSSDALQELKATGAARAHASPAPSPSASPH